MSPGHVHWDKMHDSVMEHNVWCILPEDCVQMIVAECEPRDPLKSFKTRLTLSLLSRATRQQYEEAWFKGDCMKKAFEKINAVHTLLQWNMDHTIGWSREPVLRLAEMGERYYEQLSLLSPVLRDRKEFFVNYRYKPVGGNSEIRINHYDYSKIKDLLKNLQRYRSRLQPFEQLQFFLTLQKYGVESRTTTAIRAMTPSKTSIMTELYVYDERMEVEKRDIAPMDGLYDPQFFMPLKQAMIRGLPPHTKLVRITGLSGPSSVGEQWRTRFNRMDRHRNPLERLLDICKRRKKNEKKSKKSKKSKKHR